MAKKVILYKQSKIAQNVDFQFRETAFSRRLLTFAIINHNHVDIREFLNDTYFYFERELRKVLLDHESLKVNVIFSVTFEKSIIQNVSNNSSDGDANRSVLKKEKQTLHIHTSSTIVLKDDNLNELFKNTVVNFILQKFDEAVMQGSGFTLSSINELIVEVNKYDPLSASSYIKLPKYLKDKHAIINVKNEDDKCFMWAVLSALHQVSQDADRLNKYIQYRNELNFTGIEFPMRVNSIDKFEKLNDSISINVYMYDESVKKVFPIRLSKKVKTKHIHLMLLSHETYSIGSEETRLKQHYCWIKNLSKLISTQVTKKQIRSFSAIGV